MFTPNNGDIKKAKNVGVIITDGKSNDRAYTLREARYARNSGDGITLLVVAIGNDKSFESELNGTASDPDDMNMLRVTDFSTINSIITDVQRAICNGKNKNTVEWLIFP